ncbi:hypothetical protein D9Q98_009028 [Chlorella vulgaris]|uniref:ERD4-related membrane protein n=1 Tax=Chlorella vulgaris TaxID=3077 RepID=A0A9D4YTR7_CHLVU|nr:hypothetical protein D9Q98_009028 [Chlorella vulgaris]
MSDAAAAPAQYEGEVVTSSEIITSIYMSAIFGAVFLGLWAFFRGPLRHIYLKRTQLSDLHARPPPLCMVGLWSCATSFLAPVFFLDDGEFVATAGLDALILVRFLVLGCHIFLPLTIVCCAVLLPLCMTGTYSSTGDVANMADILRYTIGNIEPGSSKLWAPFTLSYFVLAYTGYCLVQHYKSFAMLRLLYLRHNPLATAGGPPRMQVVGLEKRGWAAARSTLLQLCSPYYMLRCDSLRVKRYLEECAAAEASQAQEAAPASTTVTDGNGVAAVALTLKALGAGEQGGSECGEFAKAAVLPWWLSPEQIPDAYSVERGSTGAVHGKTSPLNRKRVLTVSAAGQPVWVSAEQYSVLFTVGGPPPSSELWRLLRPPTAATPDLVLVDSGKVTELGDMSPTAKDGQHGLEAGGGSSRSSSRMELEQALGESGGQEAGKGAEFVAAKLTEALQGLFPKSFTHLVRVYNHHAVDKLLVQHEAASTQRDRFVTDVAEARRKAAAAETNGKAKAAKGAGAKLAKAEAELAKWEAKTTELEAEIEAARSAAFEQPLGTAFIALFSDQTTAALAANVQASFVPAINFAVRPCPGPDDINWSALWASHGSRLLRALAVLPFLIFMMVFPIGVLVGALSTLDTAVCGGTPETNSLYWPWYCEQTSAGAKFLKQILQGILPSIISMTWDTYVLPMAFFFSAQSERRHLALSDLDHRITILFFSFNLANTFTGSILGGAVFGSIGNMVNQPGAWLALLGASLPSASAYFLNYIVIHALCTNFFRFVWPHEGTVLFVIFRALGMCRPKCARDEAMIRTPPSYRGARHYGSFLLIQAMALGYAVIAPLVLPAAVIFFFTAWMTWKYCALYFYERSYESGGRLFETLFKLMVGTMIVFTVFTGLCLASKKAYTAALVLIFTQLPMISMFSKRVSNTIGHYAKLLPLQATLTAPRAVLDPITFLPPPMRAQAAGWYPEWGKVWEKYGIARSSI